MRLVVGVKHERGAQRTSSNFQRPRFVGPERIARQRRETKHGERDNGYRSHHRRLRQPLANGHVAGVRARCENLTIRQPYNTSNTAPYVSGSVRSFFTAIL